MFFSDRIQSIKLGDRVLDIGPGGSPHPRADVLLELKFDCPAVAEAQRGFAPLPKTPQKMVYYDGGTFPFANGEFDYVICSHVLEHVPDVDEFVGEINRVGRAGYYEYPTIYYDYLYNFPEHTQFIKHRDGVLWWMRKSETNLAAFAPVQTLFYESFVKRHFGLVDGLKLMFFEGFEWDRPLRTRHAGRICELTHEGLKIPECQPASRGGWRALLRRLLRISARFP